MLHCLAVITLSVAEVYFYLLIQQLLMYSRPSNSREISNACIQSQLFAACVYFHPDAVVGRIMASCTCVVMGGLIKFFFCKVGSSWPEETMASCLSPLIPY